MQTSENPLDPNLAKTIKVNPKFLVAGVFLLLVSGLITLVLFINSSLKTQEPNKERQLLEKKVQTGNQESTPEKQTANLISQPTDVKAATESLSLGFNNAEQVVAFSEDQSLLIWVASNNLELANRDNEGNITRTTKIASGEITLPAITKTGNLLSVAWVEKNKAKEIVKAVVSLDSGATFSSAKELGSGSGISLASNENVITAVWHEGKEGQPSKIFLSQFSNSNWNQATRIDTSSKTPLWPSVHQSGENIFVTWRDNRDGPYAIWLRRSADNGKTWQEEQNIVSEQSGDPDICTSDGKSVFLAHHGKGKISLLKSNDSGAIFQKLGEIGSGYFAHLSCNSSKIGLAWEATTGSAKTENKKIGWAIYSNDGLRINSSEIDDGSTAASTIFLKTDQAELIWVKVGSNPLEGTLRHQFIAFKNG